MIVFWVLVCKHLFLLPVMDEPLIHNSRSQDCINVRYRRLHSSPLFHLSCIFRTNLHRQQDSLRLIRHKTLAHTTLHHALYHLRLNIQYLQSSSTYNFQLELLVFRNFLMSNYRHYKHWMI